MNYTATRCKLCRAVEPLLFPRPFGVDLNLFGHPVRDEDAGECPFCPGRRVYIVEPRKEKDQWATGAI